MDLYDDVKTRNAQPAGNDPDGARSTIMVVDDNPSNLKLLQAQLRHEAYRVIVYSEGVEALAATKREHPDLIILDIAMPEMDGFEVCRRLKADSELKEIPVLFISAYGETTDKVQAFAVGGVDYISKPFHAEEIEARVRTHLALRRQKLILGETLSSLRKTEQQRDTLVHMAVHDLRSPLMVLEATFRILKTNPNPEDCLRLAEQGLSSTGRMTTLVNAMLDMSRLESDRVDLNRETVDPGEVLQDAIGELETLTGNRTVTLGYPDPTVVVDCDANMIHRVVQNLFYNAVSFTDPKTGTISVQARRENDVLRVEVADNGPGIDEQDREAIFEKYIRKDVRRESYGLGLAFCKIAIEAHNGRIGVTPAAGGGSVFWFTLPISNRG